MEKEGNRSKEQKQVDYPWEEGEEKGEGVK